MEKVTLKCPFIYDTVYLAETNAAVVKLVYTRDLKSLGSNLMRVRFPPAAPRWKSQCLTPSTGK